MIEWPPFSTDAFLAALAEAYFPGAKPGIVECEGARYRTLVTPRGKPVSGVYAFPFYLEPLGPEAATGPALHVPYLAEVVRAVTPVGETGPPWAAPSPFVDLSLFRTWDEVVASATPPQGVNSPKRVAQKARQIGRELGPIEVQLDDRDEAAFETLIAWKSAQYARTWKSHRMTLPQNLDFHRELRRRGIFKVVAVRAGGRLVGGKVGLREHGRSLWRITVYDPELSRFSPGSVVELLTLKACFEAGDRDFDYLMGSEPYKFTFATHVRWVGNVGQEPRTDRWRRLGRMRVARIATRSPGLYRQLKALERRTLELRRRVARRA